MGWSSWTCGGHGVRSFTGKLSSVYFTIPKDLGQAYSEMMTYCSGGRDVDAVAIAVCRWRDVAVVVVVVAIAVCRWRDVAVVVVVVAVAVCYWLARRCCCCFVVVVAVCGWRDVAAVVVVVAVAVCGWRDVAVVIVVVVAV